ncbi:1140_t:CDS:1, partial [Paraglomus occultum]
FRGTKRAHEDSSSKLIVISDDRLAEIDAKWHRHPINLLRSPPASGKTTLARKLKLYLERQGYTVILISLALWNEKQYPNLLYDRNVFDQFWIQHSSIKWEDCKACTSPTTVIIDEAQTLYAGASTFWDDLKGLIDHPNSNLRVLLLSMYEDRYNQRSKTPIDFIDALGLEDLRLTVPEFKEVVDNYLEYALSEYDCDLSITDTVRQAIFDSTFGHPHLVRHTLEFLRDEYMRKVRDNDMLRSLV